MYGHINTGWPGNGPGQPQPGQQQSYTMPPPQAQYPPSNPTQPLPQGFNQGGRDSLCYFGYSNLFLGRSQRDHQGSQRSRLARSTTSTAPTSTSTTSWSVQSSHAAVFGAYLTQSCDGLPSDHPDVLCDGGSNVLRHAYTHDFWVEPTALHSVHPYESWNPRPKRERSHEWATSALTSTSSVAYPEPELYSTYFCPGSGPDAVLDSDQLPYGRWRAWGRELESE